MLLGEPIFLQVIGPWLSLKDFVALDSASCKELHEGLLAHLKSIRFRETYENQIRIKLSCGTAQNICMALEWIRKREVNLVNVEIELYNHLVLYLDQRIQPYLFITKVTVKDLDLQSPLDLVNTVMGCFPNTTKISIDSGIYRRTETSSTLKGILKALCILARSLPLKAISFWYTYSFHFTPDIIRLLSDLMVIMGSNLEVLSLPSTVAVPSHLMETLIKHCPNAKSIFGECILAPDVSLDMYSRACRSLPKLEVMANRMNFIMNDESLIPLLPKLSCLKRISFENAHLLTADSLLAARQYLPMVKFMKIAGLQYEVSFYQVSFRQISLGRISLEDIRTGKIAEFIRRILPFNRLKVMADFPREAAELLGPQLRELELTSVKILHIDDPTCLAASIPLIHALRYLESVEIESYDDDLDITEEQMVISDFLDTLRLHCTNLTTLDLGNNTYFTDAMLDIVIKGLPNLRELSLPGTSLFLTKTVLHSLAGTGKTWDLLHLPSCRKLKYIDLIEAIDKYGLKIKTLEFEFEDDIRRITESPHVSVFSLAQVILDNDGCDDE